MLLYFKRLPQTQGVLALLLCYRWHLAFLELSTSLRDRSGADEVGWVA